MSRITMFASPGVKALAEDIDAERQRQLAKWGEQAHPDGTAISGDEERADRARHACQAMAEHGMVSWRDILQSAAVIAAWVLDLDRRSGRAV